MARGEQQGWTRGLVATRARRTTVVALALAFGLIIQLLNLLDVFDGAPTWALTAIVTIQVLVLGVAIGVMVLNLREARTRPHQ